MNEDGAFDRPLLWYYSPMDSAWSLGHFENRGVVYDCMDELSQFTGAPKALVNNEARLIEHADIVFTGGYNLGEKKKKQHDNVHIFGCGVEFTHFNKAAGPEHADPARHRLHAAARSSAGSAWSTSASTTRWSARWRGCGPTGRSRWSARS